MKLALILVIEEDRLAAEAADLGVDELVGAVVAGAVLSQNNPNPFNNSTTINYTLPQQYRTAKIIVTNKSGNVLKEINVSGNGKRSVTIDASSFSWACTNMLCMWMEDWPVQNK